MSRNIDDKLTCVLDRFENSHAVLLFKTNKSSSQQLMLAKRYLPKEVKEGDVLHIKILTDKQATLDQKQIAKNILEEILNTND